MAKTKQVYVCQSCGAVHAKWAGQCHDCQSWSTLVEEVQTTNTLTERHQGFAGERNHQVVLLSSVAYTEQNRISTGLSELDRVLGGGLVEDSVILLGGDPGIGKSTLLLMALCHLSQTKRVLYVTGEESLQQVSMRAHRLGLSQNQVKLLADTQVERIIQKTQKELPAVMVIDSIQTLFSTSLSSAPGSVGQVRESAARLVTYAKQEGVALFFVGHMTKDGSLAGPRVLEHMVDCVLYFEGMDTSKYRMLRATKNRFGAVNELGVFAMLEEGLREVTNPSAIFLARHTEATPGSVVMATWEGTRALLVEIQVLVDQSPSPSPRRVCVGVEQNRLVMLLAVLHKHCGIPVYDQDVYVNIVGGLKITETGVDLAVMMAVISSLKGKALPRDLLVFGEVGLSGEIRPVPGGGERLYEAYKQGFKRAVVPEGNVSKKTGKMDMDIQGIKHISALADFFSG